MPCRHGETGIRNRLKIGLFGLRVRFPLAALNDVVNVLLDSTYETIRYYTGGIDNPK